MSTDQQAAPNSGSPTNQIVELDQLRAEHARLQDLLKFNQDEYEREIELFQAKRDLQAQLYKTEIERQENTIQVEFHKRLQAEVQSQKLEFEYEKRLRSLTDFEHTSKHENIRMRLEIENKRQALLEKRNELLALLESFNFEAIGNAINNFDKDEEDEEDEEDKEEEDVGGVVWDGDENIWGEFEGEAEYNSIHEGECTDACRFGHENE
jgi:hypothetical protein